MNDRTHDDRTGMLDALRPTTLIDSGHPAIRRFAATHAGAPTQREVARQLYLAVRDGIRYDPYDIDQTDGGFAASRCLESGKGFCVTKAALLAAAARAVGIPARVGYADVRNHLSSAKLRALMQTDLFVYHGYTELHLDGRWVKATPAFNRSLCEKAGIEALEFDGTADSVFHAFDPGGRRHMEYVRERGVYLDVPQDEIMAAWRAFYPPATGWGIAQSGAPTAATPSSSFEDELGR